MGDVLGFSLDLGPKDSNSMDKEKEDGDSGEDAHMQSQPSQEPGNIHITLHSFLFLKDWFLSLTPLLL